MSWNNKEDSLCKFISINLEQVLRHDRCTKLAENLLTRRSKLLISQKTSFSDTLTKLS
jgi:hypothetical protein